MPAAGSATRTVRPDDDAAPGTPWRVHLPSVTIDPHVETDTHLLLWQVRGATDFLVADEPRVLQAGHALWIPAGVRHGFTTRMNSVMLPIVLPVASTATTLRGVTAITVDRDLRTLFLAHVQATFTIIQPDIDIARQIFALIEDTPAVATDLPMPGGGPAAVVAEALRFNPGDDRSVHELALAAHASARTVERAFRAETGMTLREWRIRNRMETAAILLRSPTTTDAVAHRVGYVNANAFRRVFKGHFGMTPGDYIDRYRTQP